MNTNITIFVKLVLKITQLDDGFKCLIHKFFLMAIYNIHNNDILVRCYCIVGHKPDAVNFWIGDERAVTSSEF